jgi:hypothetical protein
VDPIGRESRFREGDLRREERSGRDSKGPPLERYYPDELGRKGRAPDDYADPMGRENRFRENDLKRQERRLDERDTIKGRGSSKWLYRDPRDGWDRW